MKRERTFLRKRQYTLWHPDSPGMKVTVWRWWRPRTHFARLGEALAHSRKTLDLTIDACQAVIETLDKIHRLQVEAQGIVDEVESLVSRVEQTVGLTDSQLAVRMHS